MPLQPCSRMRRKFVPCPQQKPLSEFPYTLQGVVTYYDQNRSDMFIQDATAGIYVKAERLLNIRQGQKRQSWRNHEYKCLGWLLAPV